MSSSIDEVAKTWLVDPNWQKVFKHTSDVIEDYITYALVGVGTICLSVRLLSTLGTGDLLCVLVAVEVNGTRVVDLGPYPSGGTLGALSYASTEEQCIRAVFSVFLEYLPYIMLLQTLILVVVEKFTFRVPRVAQRVERFYKNIVEESLFGKDPDVAEDMYDSATSTEAISRRRQRNEICVALKQTSFLHDAYISKNLAEVILILIYLPFNIYYIVDDRDRHAPCAIRVESYHGILDEPGFLHFQCAGKKMSFFRAALLVHVLFLCLHLACSVTAILWCLFNRPVTNLLKTIESIQKGGSFKRLKDKGKDFLFLFDLLAHSCGLESTLRVLTHSDEVFYDICKPTVDITDSLSREEDKLMVTFGPAIVEKWLDKGMKVAKPSRPLGIDSYEVTIFPAESANHTNTVPSKAFMSMTDSQFPIDIESGFNQDGSRLSYSTTFPDLNGGRVEYTVTIATMIGKSRMKGERLVTHLVPYGPEKPGNGMVKLAGTHQVEIFWDPPKGEFGKYTLKVEPISEFERPRATSVVSAGSSHNSNFRFELNDKEMEAANDDVSLEGSNVRVLNNLSHKFNTYTILGLNPGNLYRIELGTKTGNVDCQTPIRDTILTKPLAPRGLRISNVTSTTCHVTWLKMDGHSCLRGYQIQVRTGDGKVFKDVAVKWSAKSFDIKGLQPSQDYDIAVTSLCTGAGNLRTESDVSMMPMTTLPENVKNFTLESATPNSLTIKWDNPLLAILNHRFKLVIKAETAEEDEVLAEELVDNRSDITDLRDIKYYKRTVDVPGDKSQHTFVNLPNILGSGHLYKVSIVTIAVTSRENEVASPGITERFMTKPLPPTNFRLGSYPLQIIWHRSPTPSVYAYRVRWRLQILPGDGSDPGRQTVNLDELASVANISGRDAIVSVKKTNSERRESVVDALLADLMSFTLPSESIQVDRVYTISIFALAEAGDMSSESKELMATVRARSENELQIVAED